MEYEDRTDFRAFDVLVQALEKASPADLHNAWRTANDYSKDLGVRPARRAMWASFRLLIGRVIKL